MKQFREQLTITGIGTTTPNEISALSKMGDLKNARGTSTQASSLACKKDTNPKALIN